MQADFIKLPERHYLYVPRSFVVSKVNGNLPNVMMDPSGVQRFGYNWRRGYLRYSTSVDGEQEFCRVASVIIPEGLLRSISNYCFDGDIDSAKEHALYIYDEVISVLSGVGC